MILRVGKPSIALVAASVLLSRTPAAAATFYEAWKAGGATCYARRYDAKHLVAHPRQRLTGFTLGESVLSPVEPRGSFELTLTFTLKGDKEVYQSQAICRDAPSRTVHCGVEGDGGSFTVRSDGAGLLLTIASMVVEGSRDISPDLAKGGDDRVVRLYASPQSACRQR